MLNLLLLLLLLFLLSYLSFSDFSEVVDVATFIVVDPFKATSNFPNIIYFTDFDTVATVAASDDVGVASYADASAHPVIYIAAFTFSFYVSVFTVIAVVAASFYVVYVHCFHLQG